MRRNTPRGRGNRRGGGANFEGPLMTDHLKDLDLELQLLKRKRQMIEQQQQMMGRQGSRGYNYVQPQTYKQQPYDYKEQEDYSRSSNFSHMYDESPNTSYSNKFGNQLGRKRQVESPWDNGTPPKRFSGPKGKFAKKPFGDRSGRSLDRTPESIGRRPQLSGRPSHSPNTPQSLMSLKPKPPTGQRRPPPVQHNFKPSRVTKPKPVAVTNLDSYPVVERKRLVAEASNLVSDAGDNRILSIDRVPTQQMTGRLELALGSILKDLKQAYSTVKPHDMSFQSVYLQRVMKQFIRERIRSVMLGKVVGNVTDILMQYRKEFPTNTDIDILKAALDAQEVIDKKKFGIKLVEADDPEEYFSVNMQKLIEVTLNEMFCKLHEIYENSGHEEFTDDISPEEGNRATNISRADETTSDLDASKPNECNSENDTSKPEETNPDNDANKPDESNPDNDASPPIETTSKVDASKTDETSTDKDTNNIDETSTENDASNLNETKMENDTSKADETITDTDGNKDTSKIIDDSTLDDAVKVDSSDAAVNVDISDAVAKLDSSDAAKPIDEPQESVNDDKIFKVFKPNSSQSRQCEQFVATAIKRRMPKLLRKQIPYIIKLLNLNQMYKTASEAILMRSVKKVGSHVGKRDVGQKGHANTSHGEVGDDSLNITTEQEVKKTPLGPSRYFVKIIARPSLPKRKAMQAFLNDFNPRTIKKHKNMHSLLFVGFTNQEDFERILAATGTAIGRTTLEIKVSEKASDKRQGIEVQDKVEQTSADTSLDNLIGGDLDDKINDLLSSIRKAEEETGEESSLTSTEPAEIINVKTDAVSQNEKTTEPAKENDIVEEIEELKEETSQKTEVTADTEKASETVEETNNTDKELKTIDEAGDRVEALKNEVKESGRATPTRTSSRLANATPGTIRTRRASRLAQNNP